jgi:tRNA pseudouridine55 synthase
MNGVIVIDKPGGMTSHDVVNRVRRILGQKAVGHLGTLDPMATGVLPIVTGKLTRLAQFYAKSDKAYEGEIRFGFATDTYDAEGEAVTTAQVVSLERGQLEAVAAEFRGVIQQMPPSYSAKKIAGVPAYKLARKDKEVELKAVQVEVKELEILGVESARARFRARVSSGTYLRSIAHEMGQRLGCGAHLSALRRTAVAEFTLADAVALEELAEAAESGEIERCLIHPRKLLPDLPSVTADDAAAGMIRSGRSVNLPELSSARTVKVFQGQRELIAIATRIAGSLFHAGIVLMDG